MTVPAVVEDFLAHFTPTMEQRRQFTAAGWAMPDGSFYIRPLPDGRTDLHNAILAIGRATPGENQTDTQRRNAIRRHCIKRAKALGLTDMIPDTWNSDGSFKQSGILDGFDEFLAHFGVKGMRWGIRKEETSGGSSRGGQRAEKRFAKTASSTSTRLTIINNTADRMNSDILPRINNDPRFRGRNLNNDLRLRARYMAEVRTAWLRELQAQADKFGTSPSGRTIKISDRIDIMDFTPTGFNITLAEARHADGNQIHVSAKTNSLGHFISFTVEDPDLIQFDSFDEFLAHYGIKGMHWGIRRAEAASGRVGVAGHVVNPIIVRGAVGAAGRVQDSGLMRRQGGQARARGQMRPGGEDVRLIPLARRIQARIAARQGQRQERASRNMSGDAARAKELQRRVNQHGTKALDNNDLQFLVTRLNLENQYGKFSTRHVSTGRKVTNEALKFGGDVARQQAAIFAGKYAQKGLEALLKQLSSRR